MQLNQRRVQWLVLGLALAISTAFEIACVSPSVQIKDKTFLGSMGEDGAAEFHLFDKSTSQISWPEFVLLWNDSTDPLVAMHASDFAQGKKELEDLCTYYGHCEEPALVKMRAFFSRVQSFANKMKLRDIDTD